ncbi:MAG: prepilin peptidase [Pseudobutyrivibrio sp.]|nr:prepilin peptidase [Pseudobutyrivibrio sp.]
MEIGLIPLLAITAYEDIKEKRIHGFYIVIFGLLGLAINIAIRQQSFRALALGMVPGLILYIFGIITGEKIGKGDGLLIMVCGMYMGLYSVMGLIWLASIIATIVGVCLLALKKKDRKSEMPFIPFLFIAFITLEAVKFTGGYLA